jgi:hypothetical protein
MSYICERCKKKLGSRVASARESLVPYGNRRVCFACYDPEKNKEFGDWQRENRKEKE